MKQELVLRLLKLLEADDGPEQPAPKSHLQIGKSVLIRTVTHYHVGRITWLSDDEVVLEDAAWIADTGRFYTALEKGAFSEVEPFMDGVTINRRAIIDVAPWKHALPRVQK